MYMKSLRVEKSLWSYHFVAFLFFHYHECLPALTMSVVPDVHLDNGVEVGVEGRVRVTTKGWVTTEYSLAYFFTYRAHPTYCPSHEERVSLSLR